QNGTFSLSWICADLCRSNLEKKSQCYYGRTMGTFLHSLCVRTADYAEVKSRLLRWLSAKGYEPTDDAPLFPAVDGSKRGVCLLSNDRWVVVLYSKFAEEGDRLRFELIRPEWPILQVWVHDSDLDRKSTRLNSSH